MLPRRPVALRSPTISVRGSPALQLTRLLSVKTDSPPVFRPSSGGSVVTISSATDYHQLSRTHTHVLDARTPSEFEDDRIPLSRNAPVLNDGERIEVGTLHKKDKFAARLLGASLIAANISALLPQLNLTPKSNVLVYCWRGGERSKALSHVISRLGCQTSVLEHGYKAYRTIVRSFLHRSIPHSFFVVGGLTGVGKSRVLHALKAEGEQVLDLEEAGKHRGSAFGLNPGIVQPSQALFETHIFHALSSFDTKRAVFVESESALAKVACSKVGRLAVPPFVWEKMKSCRIRFVVPAPVDVRVQNIRREYSEYEKDFLLLDATLDKLTPLHGHATVNAWKQMGKQGQWNNVVEDLLIKHYDPAYVKSAKKSYSAPEELKTPDLNSNSMAEVISYIRAAAETRMKHP